MILYRRHKPTCSQCGKPRAEHNKCKCKIWADGVLGGVETRRSMKTRDWTKANQDIQAWEADERVSKKEVDVTLADAWTSAIADLEARALSHGTVTKYKLLQKQMKVFADARGLALITDFNV